MKKLITILLVSTMTILLFACKDNKISREQAEQLIKAKFNYPKYEYTQFNSREISNDREASSHGRTPQVYNCPQCGDEKIYGIEYTVVSQNFQNLENAGLIKVFKNNFYKDSPGLPSIECPICTNNSALPHKYGPYNYIVRYLLISHSRTYYNDAVFTDLAKPYLKGENVAITTTNFSAITGIVENNNTADVQFTEITNATPFGKIFKSNEGTYTRNISFIKYDDGWRISQ